MMYSAKWHKIYKMEIQLFKPDEKGLIIQPEIINALSSSLVNALPDDNIKGRLIIDCREAYMTAGIKAPESSQEVTHMIDEIIRQMRINKTNIRIDEIKIAFSNGVHKKYGDYFGLNAVSFYEFIKSYVIDTVRLETIKERNKAMQENNKPTDEEIYQLKKTNALSALNEFKAKRTCGRFALDVYDFFCELKLIDLSQEEKNEYWRLAKQEYQNYLNSQRAKMITMEDKRKLDKEYAEALEGGKTARFVVISKRLIVDDYFRTIVMEETDLLTLIEPS